MNNKKSCCITFPLIQYPSNKTTDLNFKYANFLFSLNFHTCFGDGFQYMERRKSSNSNVSHFLTRLQQLEVLLFLCSTNTIIANSQWLSCVTWSVIANSQWLSRVIWSVIANSQWLSHVTWSVIVKSQWLSHITWSKNIYKMSDP